MSRKRQPADGCRASVLFFLVIINKLTVFDVRQSGKPHIEKLNTMGAFGDLKTCRRKFLLNYFSEDLTEDCGHCDNCNTEFERFDGTIIAQKALSAVYRTGQRFGLSYLIDFLRGSQAKTIRDEHKNLKTYGVGADVSKNNWFDYFKDLIAQGYLAQTEGQYPVIVLTEKSEAVLKGVEKVELIKVTIKEDKKPSLVSKLEHEYLKDLFDELRQVRTVFAREENVPPYVIFSDATLVEMATYLPLNDSEMRRISGIGDLKMQKYGADFLEVIMDYWTAQPPSRITLNAERETKTRANAIRGAKHLRRLVDSSNRDFNSEIDESRGMAQSTIKRIRRFIERSGELETCSRNKIERRSDCPLNAFAVAPARILGEDYTSAKLSVMATM